MQVWQRKIKLNGDMSQSFNLKHKPQGNELNINQTVHEANLTDSFDSTTFTTGIV